MSDSTGYKTATFADVSGYEFVRVKLYDTVGGEDYAVTVGIETSDIPASGYTFSVELHTLVTLKITLTSIQATQYDGGYTTIYADVEGAESYAV